MVKRPSISVIMSCYNEDQFIGRAIESILQQTFSDFEFIIVDDASTDGTVGICQQYAQQDQRIKFYQRTENAGSCTIPLNMAIKKANAPYLARMDANDYSHPTRLEKQYRFLEEHPEIAILGTGVNLIDKSTNKITKKFHFREHHKDIVKYRYLKPFVAHPTVMVRKEVYDYYDGYNEKMVRGQDMELWLKAFLRFKFHNLQEILFDYYRRPVSMGETDFSALQRSITTKLKAMRRNKELVKFMPYIVYQYLFFFWNRIILLFQR